jgi:2-hydroxy-6-oxonona-2,4-dienedioate hydrolase
MSALVQRPVGRRVAPVGDALAGPTGRLVSTWVPVHGLRLHALVSADDPPPDAPTIVLVHGVAVSSRYLAPLADHLAPRARVYVPDLPGYGRSDRPPGPDLTVPELADALVTWMDRAGLQRPHLLGNSFGCQVIADLAARYPDRVGRLVLQGPTMDPHARSTWRQALRWLAVAPFERYSEVLVLLRDLWDLGPRRAANMIRIALDDPIEQKLARSAAPTLIVRGSRDAIVPQRWAEEAARLLPNGQLVVIERAAHTINYSQPAWLVEAIWPFLNGAGQERR